MAPAAPTTEPPSTWKLTARSTDPKITLLTDAALLFAYCCHWRCPLAVAVTESGIVILGVKPTVTVIGGGTTSRETDVLQTGHYCCCSANDSTPCPMQPPRNWQRYRDRRNTTWKQGPFRCCAQWLCGVRRCAGVQGGSAIEVLVRSVRSPTPATGVAIDLVLLFGVLLSLALPSPVKFA